MDSNPHLETLSIGELPKHSHTYIDSPHLYAERDTTHNTIICLNDSQSANQMTYNTGTAGNGHHHNNIPPYVVIYAWKRV